MRLCTIGNVTIPGHFTLAPMAGVTDTAFRTVCRECGAAMTTTEMVSSRGLVYRDSKTARLLHLETGEHPAAAQIFGNDPAICAEAAVLALEQSGADILDVNMGCPTPKIVRGGHADGTDGIGDGSALMKDPDLAAKVVEAIVRAVTVPVTVKMRLGWDSVTAPEFARRMEAAGAAAVCVHGRTREQFYSGHADWAAIAQVKQAVRIPVICNGDVAHPEDGVRILRETGADLCMIGRGAMGNPWLFGQCQAALEGKPWTQPSLEEKKTLIRRQAQLAMAEKGERVALQEFRHHLAWYVKAVPGAAKFRAQINEVRDWESLRSLTEAVLQGEGGDCHGRKEAAERGQGGV